MTVSIDEMIASFAIERTTNRRMAAETAYAIAFRYRNEDVDGARRLDQAKLWAERSIELFDQTSSESMHDVAVSRQSIGGVALPDLIHSDVVRERLSDVLF